MSKRKSSDKLKQDILQCTSKSDVTSLSSALRNARNDMIYNRMKTYMFGVDVYSRSEMYQLITCCDNQVVALHEAIQSEMRFKESIGK